MPVVPLIEWTAPKHYHSEKSREWYWAVGIIFSTAAIISFIFGNPIFGILIIVSAIALSVSSYHKPKELRVSINDRGVLIDNILYPYLHLESFWIDTDGHEPKLIIKSNKTFAPMINLIIRDVDDEDVRQILLQYIAETEHIEPLANKLLERLGF